MSMIRQSTPWTRQPQTPVGIDWSNPITRGLVGAWYPGAGLVNVVDQKRLTSNLVAYSVSPSGTVADFTVNHGSGPYIQFGFDLAGAGTVYALVSRDTSASGTGVDAVAELFTNRTAGQANFWELNLGNAFGAAPDVDKPRFSNDTSGIGTIYLNGAALSGNNPATTALNNKQFYSVAGVASSGFNASGAGVILVGAANISVGTNFQLNGRVALSLIFNTAKSARDIAAISANPWRLFAPESRRLFVPASVGGGATTITCTVGAASAVGVSGFVNTALQANVGAAAAAGVTASVNRTLQTSVAASSATGVTSLVSRTLQASVGAAAATGVTAQLATTVSAGPGNASAAGVNAVINTAGNTTIACSVGAASAVGVAALANTTLQTAVGAASGQGVLARLNVTLQTGVGAASAVGVSFSSGGVIYIPALLQFTSPSRAQTFTSPSRLQSFTSPARSGP